MPALLGDHGTMTRTSMVDLTLAHEVEGELLQAYFVAAMEWAGCACKSPVLNCKHTARLLAAGKAIGDRFDAIRESASA